MAGPKISVVTINFNMGGELSETIQSVLEQTYPNLEYVIIDGGSTDGSLDIIRRYSSRIASWTSEPDGGRYDAMNKGVSAASGSWVIFMNSGDRFCDDDVLENVFQPDPHDDADIVYGHVLRRYTAEKVQRMIPAQSLSALPLRMPCSHQSLFARRELLLEHPFSNELSIIADHDFLLRAQLAGARFRKVDHIISAFSTGGASDQQRLEAMRQLHSVLERLNLLTARRRLSHAILLLRALAGARMKRILPKSLTAWILKHKTFD